MPASRPIIITLPQIMSDNCVLPEFDTSEAASIANRLFGLSGPLKQLDGERDLNYRIGEPGDRFVFKIANADENPAMLECQHQVFVLLEQAGVFPRSVTALSSRNGHSIEMQQSRSGQQHACRAVPFIEGRLFADLVEPSAALLEDIGWHLALLDRALEGFDHPALERPLLWKMDHVLDLITAFKPLLADEHRRDLVEYFENGYRERALPLLDKLRRAVIHNDANRANVLVDEAGEKVVSIIDFGDMTESWLVIEPAIAAAYAMLDRTDPLAVAASVLRGYAREIPLQPVESGLVFDFICMRLCMSVCNNAHQTTLEPGNEYLSTDVDQAWELLRGLRDIDPATARARLFPG